MNKQDRETLRLTLMALENNSVNVKNIRLSNLNNLSFDEVQALLHVEQKVNDVKSVITDIFLKQYSSGNHLSMVYDIGENRFYPPTSSFLHDNVD